jgi:hypothetical protein
MPRSALQRQALQAGALATVLCLAGVLVVERTAGRSLLVSKSELLKTVHDLDAAAAGLEGRAAAVPTSYGSLSAVAARKDLSSYFDDMAESPRAAKAKQPSAKPAAVDGTTAAAKAAPVAAPAAAPKVAGAALVAKDQEIQKLEGEVEGLKAARKTQTMIYDSQVEAQDATIASLKKEVHKLEAQEATPPKAAPAVDQGEAINEAVTIAKELFDMQERRAMRSQDQGAAAEQRRGVVGGQQEAQPRTRAFANIIKAAEAAEAQRGSLAAYGGERTMGVPLPTEEEASKLPGVNIADWKDPRVRTPQTAEWAATHPDPLLARVARRAAAAADFVPAAEGGRQLASSKGPSAAAPAPVEEESLWCPHCGFLENCEVNPMARGFSRATGTYGHFPAYPQNKVIWGGGGEHQSTLASVGGVQQSQPLWEKLARATGLAQSSRRLLSAHGTVHGTAPAAEGGAPLRQVRLASSRGPVAAAPPPVEPIVEKAAAPPKCVCPACKLGDEKVGMEDEHHEQQLLDDPELLHVIDDELMKLDPAYAARRYDWDESAAYGPNIAKHMQFFAPHGRANPLSDFQDDNADYHNQVEDKSGGVW